ncbi:MAG TPA: 23S rRNA (uracil(1939)-C(5))-methyltransferase RlmD [Granulicella sp.]
MKLTIHTMFYGGAGSGLDERGTLHSVPFVLPGEQVEISLTHAGPELIAIDQPSPHRVNPRCPHFGPCGGCQYQHVAYPEQTAIKRQILQDTFAHEGLTTPAPGLHTAEPWQYRNRIRLRVASVDGELRLGYNRRGSYEMLPIDECPIAAPLLIEAAQALIASAEPLPGWADNLDEIELFANHDQSKLQITLFLRSDRKIDLALLCTQLQQRIPQLAGAGIVVTGTSGRKHQPGATWGTPGLLYHVAGRDYWVSRPSFFQVNRLLVDTLVKLAADGRSGDLAWDLYAGVGLFSRVLAERFARVTAVETVAADLTQSLRSPHRAVGSTVLDFLRAAILERDRPDLILADPPRAGLGPEVCALLARIRAPQIVYVSCDPVTLARDLRALVDSGYTVNTVDLVDLFPQTFHMETVVTLHR